MLNTKEEIEKWLNKYEVENFVINDDLTVDVNGDVSLYSKLIKQFPFKFGVIIGSFYCFNNYLESLKNSPDKVNGNFNCSYNNLTSLEHCSQIIGGDFDCSKNNLTSLEYCPEVINGDFNCSKNNLTSLEHCPEVIHGSFDCFNNNLTSLEGCTEAINGSFNCSNNNLTSLEYCPQKVSGSFNCAFNDLTSLKHCPEKIYDELDFFCNKIDKKLLYLFSSDVKGDIVSDFGDKEKFLFEVKKQKSLKEKKELNKVISLPENNNSELTKKRL